jgi:hypothetical protein
MLSGWIAPSGKFYRCGLFRHLEVIEGTPVLKALVSGGGLYDKVTALINTHCLRVVGCDKNLHFEGKPTAITFQAAKDLAEEHNMTPVFEN